MISGATSFFPQNPESYQMYGGMEDIFSSTAGAASGVDSHSQTLLYNLSVLREKVQQVQSLVSIVVSPDQIQHESAAVAVANAGTLIQEIIVAASSMMYAFQQVATGSVAPSSGNELHHHHMKLSYEGQIQQNNGAVDQVVHNLDNTKRSIFGRENHYNNNSSSVAPIIATSNGDGHKKLESTHDVEKTKEFQDFSSGCDIIELDAADLLAKYTHYCQVCGKGFKRDANLRMHMRAHGDEYKTNAALSNPTKGSGTAMGQKDFAAMVAPRKYSCPHEGCRWNRKHAKFQPLKSMVCVKNHYKRTHCPKMYVCNRCNRKQFSVLSDLRTHEKHCGDLKWRCSCGTTFSRKDKLMGHISLFVGHSPVVLKHASPDYHGMQLVLDGR